MSLLMACRVFCGFVTSNLTTEAYVSVTSEAYVTPTFAYAEDELPTETTHLDHPEVSIHFGHLRAVAQGLGLQAELLPLHSLLDIDLSPPPSLYALVR